MSEAAPTPQGPASSGPTPGPGGDPPPQVKKPRGRPFGSRTRTAPPLAATDVPPDGAAPASQQEEGPKRRRRSKVIDKEGLAKQMVDLHAMLARFTGIGLIQISIEEGKTLAEAVESVSREYDLAFDGKTGALIQLIFAAGVIYGPRLMLYQTMKKRGEVPVRADSEPNLNGSATSAGH